MLLIYREQMDDGATSSILTHNNSSDCEEHKSIFPEERQHVLFGDLLHFPLGLHGAYVNAFPDTLHPAEPAQEDP